MLAGGRLVRYPRWTVDERFPVDKRKEFTPTLKPAPDLEEGVRMGPDRPQPEETEHFLEQVRAGNRQALDRLLALHRGFLRAIIDLRLDRKMRARVDASDIVQEAQLEAARRIDDYIQRRPMPFHIWLQKTAYENLLRIRRQHVAAVCRSVENEAPLPERSSILLAHELLGGGPTPSQGLREKELSQKLRQ